MREMTREQADAEFAEMARSDDLYNVKDELEELVRISHKMNALGIRRANYESWTVFEDAVLSLDKALGIKVVE